MRPHTNKYTLELALGEMRAGTLVFKLFIQLCIPNHQFVLFCFHLDSGERQDVIQIHGLKVMIKIKWEWKYKLRAGVWSATRSDKNNIPGQLLKKDLKTSKMN